MPNPTISILISSYKRLEFLKRVLFSIAVHGPSQPYEVIIADETSDQSEAILEQLHLYDARFQWKFVSCSQEKYEEEGGPKKFFNNPSWTNNVAFRYSSGSLIFLQGNDCVAWNRPYDKMIEDFGNGQNSLVFSTTYNMPDNVQLASGPEGANLTQGMVDYCKEWPLQSIDLQTLVTNYISLTHKKVWVRLGGYDENYVKGIACEDSDFVQRFRALPQFPSDEKPQVIFSNAISLHCDHGGKTMYNEAKPSIITTEKWDEGLNINREYYHSWDGTYGNRQTWPLGTYGITGVIEHGY